MTPLYLRRMDEPEQCQGPLSVEQLLALGLSSNDSVGLSPAAPFCPLDRELDRNGALRDALLTKLQWAPVSRYARLRWGLFSGLIPLFILADLDRQLWRAGRIGAGASLSVDLFWVLAVALDLGRPTPRHPRVTAAVYASASMRLALLIAARCSDGVHWLMYLCAAIAALAAAGVVWLSPGPRQVADQLRKALAMAPPTRLPAPSSKGFYAYILYAFGAAALLPAMLWGLRAWHAPAQVQLLAFVGFSLVVPHVGRVVVGREPAPFASVLSEALGQGTGQELATPGHSFLAIRRIVGAALTSLVLSFALVRGVQNGLEALGHVQRCVSADPGVNSSIGRLVEAQYQEIASDRAPVELAFVLLTAVVVPIAEELVYRGLVQHALRQRVKRRWAIGLASLLFGLAHLVVYRGMVYQTVLLGLSFGLAYEAAGLGASILVHMLWNLWLSM